ncbi:hypothetical protein [Bradyrhizobium icense]|uniref:Uncharacterized protein n=1 Tax=Bradyrhizobium icense TaxID=1274631 RepID=A0A1B1U9I6_9BRAD|nr:hypothetical protein [Bradyrhizobium icense]ANV99355.1 hypothetical protein LMTR13_03340 [Bradyrhizobium icense]
MTPEQLAELKTDAILRARLAKLMARDCFRNTMLEDFHAGKVPSSQTGDYSDVKVVTPYGEIQWNRLSRLSDAEMKALMMDVVDHCYDFLMELCSPDGREIIEKIKHCDELPAWNEPEPVILRELPSLRQAASGTTGGSSSC